MPSFSCTSATLKELPFFSTLSEAEVTKLLPFVQFRTYNRGMFVIASGSAIDGLYIIVSGRLKVVLQDERGRQFIVAQLGPKDLCGEALMQECRTGEAVEAVTQCELVYLPRKAVLECLERNPTAAMFILAVVTARLSDARRKMGNLALETVGTRVLRVLLEQGHEEHGEWRVDVGAETIAALVGASREMVSRVTKNLINRGVVRRYKRKLIVANRSRLAEYAQHSESRLERNGSASSKAPYPQFAR